MGENNTRYDTTHGDVFEVGGKLQFESAGILDLSNLSPHATFPGLAAKMKKISVTSVPADDSEIDTGWDLPAKCIVLDVFIDVTTAEATGGTKTLDVGTNGSGSDDPDGFLDGVSVANFGIVRGSLASGGQTLGTLLHADEDGAGVLVPEPDTTSGGESVTYTAGSADFAELHFDLYVVYIEI